MKKFVAFITSILLAASLLTGCGKAEKKPAPAPSDKEPVKIKLAHVVNEKDGFHIAALKFKELVEQKTNNTVQVELFPNATLGDERTLLEGMQMGTVDAGIITNGPVANFVPEIAVFELPFLFASREEAYKVLDGDVGKEILGKLEAQKIKGLAYAERGFRNLTNSKQAVNTPDDLKGLKIRVMENPVYIDTFKTLGANTVPMAWTETLTALQQGTIDGQENPVNVIYSFKLYETQKHLSLTRHTYSPATIMMSLDKFNSLSEDVQKILMECAQQAAEHERKVNTDSEEKQLQELKDKGMQIVNPNVNAFKETVKPVYEKYSSKYGEYLTKIQSQLK